MTTKENPAIDINDDDNSYQITLNIPSCSKDMGKEIANSIKGAMTPWLDQGLEYILIQEPIKESVSHTELKNAILTDIAEEIQQKTGTRPSHINVYYKTQDDKINVIMLTSNQISHQTYLGLDSDMVSVIGKLVKDELTYQNSPMTEGVLTFSVPEDDSNEDRIINSQHG